MASVRECKTVLLGQESSGILPQIPADPVHKSAHSRLKPSLHALNSALGAGYAPAKVLGSVLWLDQKRQPQFCLKCREQQCGVC